METTTIYTKVAVIRQQQVQSPLDALNGKARPQHIPRPVGRMRIFVRRRQGEATVADAELTIINEGRCISLDGIVVREQRPGWVTLEVPPLEAWEQRLCWLTPPQRERIESAEFFKFLQEQVTLRYLAL
jgi:integrase/recombinase XerD